MLSMFQGVPGEYSFAKPSHKHYILCHYDPEEYNRLAVGYQKAKCYGFRGISAWATGPALKDIVIEVSIN